MGATLFNEPDGSTFVASTRHVPAVPPFGSFVSGTEGEDRLRAWCAEKWNILFQLKRGEQQRLKTCELFYAGFHYENAWDNRNNPVTNYCYSTVESIWPILTEARPRPEPTPRRFMEKERIDRMRDFAVYKMDSTGFDRLFRICVRDLLKYGWTCPMVAWDAMGRAVGTYLSPFDFYPDAAADESKMEGFAIAGPVSTRRLRALFPKVRDRIQPDNIASPSYEVLVQPYLDAAGVLGGLHAPQFIGTMPSTIMEGQPAATSSGEYGIDTGNFSVFANTSFLVQLFVRDYTTMPVLYRGMKQIPHETGQLTIPYSKTVDEPCSPSGWRMIPLLANGTLLAPPTPVDVCLGGIPLVIGRNYEQGGRFYPFGELDQIIPIQRDINRTDASIARALELQANPPVLVSLDARIGSDKSSVEGGEMIRHARGSTINYLQPGSLAESHFIRRASRRQDVQIVAGTPDALQGQRPIGVEAGTAIRQLTQSATGRARAKSAAMLEWAALLLQKLMRADAYKSEEAIYFRGSDGQDMWMNPADLRADTWDVRWAQQSGTAQGEQDRQDLDLQLLQLGVIDPQQLLDDLNFPGRADILQRVGLRQMQAAQAQAAAGPPNKNGGGR